MSWSRTNSTLYRSSSALSSANSSSLRDTSARLTLRSSAPMWTVSGSASMEVMVVMGFLRLAGSRSCWVTDLLGHGFAGSRSFEAEHGRTDAAARFEVPVRLHRVLQGVPLVDLD